MRSLVCIIALLSAVATATAQPLAITTHQQFQAVNPDGTSSFDDNGSWQVSLEGILLNNPEQWLDPTPNPQIAPWFMGGQWEIIIQGQADDHAGTFCWIGQNYKNGPGNDSYTNQEFTDELTRLNHDPNTAYTFRAGDLIRITGTYLFYAGKLNINENHQTDPAFDFKVELIKPAVGLPQPEPITLADLKTPDDKPIFDHTRQTGCEYYQARLVRIENVTITDPQNWSPGNTITIADSQNRTLPVKLGLGHGISRHQCPTGKIDVVGIIDQASNGYPPDSTKGYRLLVFNYDNNGLVLTDTQNPRGNLPGDINHDHIVNLEDFAQLTANWLDSTPGLYLN